MRERGSFLFFWTMIFPFKDSPIEERQKICLRKQSEWKSNNVHFCFVVVVVVSCFTNFQKLLNCQILEKEQNFMVMWDCGVILLNSWIRVPMVSLEHTERYKIWFLSSKSSHDVQVKRNSYTNNYTTGLCLKCAESENWEWLKGSKGMFHKN